MKATRKGRLPALLLLCIAGMITPEVLTAQICSPFNSANDGIGVGTIGLSGFGVSDYELGVAASYYSSACSGDYGSTFPGHIINGSGEINIQVFYNSGWAPPNVGGCGLFDGVRESGYLVGGSIEVWEMNSYGAPCDPISDSIAHELGHVYGMANVDAASQASCSGSIMAERQWNGQYMPTRSVTGDNCNSVRGRWYTPDEQAADEQSVYCQAYGCSPIVINLDGSGLELSGRDNPVLFDINPGGPVERLTWTVGESGDAFLFLDRNENETVDNGAELFGNFTPLSGGETASNGYVALAEFDTIALGGNRDGLIDAGDEVFGELKAWVDTNHNGVSEPGELTSLSAAGIVSIELRYHHSGQRDRHGNLLRFRAKVWVLNPTGKTRATNSWDVFLQAVP